MAVVLDQSCVLTATGEHLQALAEAYGVQVQEDDEATRAAALEKLTR